MTKSEEIAFCHELTEFRVFYRNEALDAVYKYIKKKSAIGFSENDLTILWKGLFYSLYNADMPLVQEDLSENIAQIIHKFKNNDQKQLYFKIGLEAFCREWDRLDRIRLDKYMMLFSRLLRHTLIFLRSENWPEEEVSITVTALETTIICPTDNINLKPMGLKLYVVDIIMIELAKIGREQMPSEICTVFILPFLKVFALSTQEKYKNQITVRLINWILAQSILDESETLHPRQHLKEKNDGTVNDEPLDPRAGGVDVILPRLNINFDQLVRCINDLCAGDGITQKRRKKLRKLANNLNSKNTKFMAPDPSTFERGKKHKKKHKKKQSKRAVEDLFSDTKCSKVKKDVDYGAEITPGALSGSNIIPILKKEKWSKKSKFSRSAFPVSKERVAGSLIKETKRQKVKQDDDYGAEMTPGALNGSNIIPILKKEKSFKKSKISKSGLPVSKECVAGDLFSDTKCSKVKKDVDYGAEITPGALSGSNIIPILKKEKWLKKSKFSRSAFPVLKERVAGGRRTPNSQGKLLKIDVKENKSYLLSDYEKSVIGSPGIPFASDKKPKPSVLKGSSHFGVVQRSFKKKGKTLTKPMKKSHFSLLIAN